MLSYRGSKCLDRHAVVGKKVSGTKKLSGIKKILPVSAVQCSFCSKGRVLSKRHYCHWSGCGGASSISCRSHKRICSLVPNDIFIRTPSLGRDWELHGKYGMDGSSSHPIYKQGFSEEGGQLGCDGNIFLCSYVPLQLKDRKTGQVLWKNPTPSSRRYCRPIKFMFCKETTELIKNTEDYLKGQVDMLAPTVIEFPNGIIVFIHHDLRFTMVDGKVCNTIWGVGSLRCFICTVTPKEINDIDKVRSRPINPESLNFCIAPLHAKIRSFEGLLHLAYKKDVQEWAPKDPDLKQVVLARKNLIQNAFKTQMNLIVDQPRSDGPGNSNDGNTARRFYQEWAKSADILQIDQELVRRLAVITT